MTAEIDWARLKELFDRAAGLAPEERDALLAHECADAPDLRRQVEELLAAHEAAAGFLSAPTRPRVASLAETREASDPAPGTLLGPYKLLQQIGEGGFGAVFMAEQQQPIVRKVALKVIKLGMDTKQVIARFEAERQALALMDHPNIARIFDAGATEAGRPYFVMELVRGFPITEYCDRERLTTRQRLELFLPVCYAVAHAHQKGVIHRDLKPSNVLVTLHDGRPVPKVIDFGIARAIHQRLTERTLFTEYGQMIGTPEYMSPEQGEMSGLDIDTRTDIYSLGALLYELLTGEKLFDPKRLRSLALAEIQRVLRQEEPPRPSARVSSLGATAADVAQHRGVQASQLVRLLQGEPDWIVVKAIAKDRTRRYDSAGALAQDIERYLRSEPVSASPPGVAYRASRFVRRHRLGVGVALVLGASLVLGIAVATLGLVRARRAENLARFQARRNALDVQAMRALLKDDVPTYRARVEESIALQRSSAPVDTAALADYLTNTVGLLAGLEFLGATSASVDSFRRRLESEAIDLLLEVETPMPSVIDNLVLVRDHLARTEPERLPEAIRRSLILRQRAGAPDTLLAADRGKLARLRHETGMRDLQAGRARAARSALAEAVELAKQAGIGGLVVLSAARGDLGACLTDLGEFAAAESLLLDSYRVLGAREQLMQLVRLYQLWGKPEKARAFAGRTCVASLRDLGPLAGPPSTTRRGRGFSGKLGDRWIWAFGPAVSALKPRSNIRWNSWSWTRDRDARDGIVFQHPTDHLGVPLELLTLAPAERTYRDSVDSWLNLDPAAVIADPARGRALVLYTKVLGGLRQAGSSLAVWKAGAPAPRRLVVRPGTKEPTLLFQGDEPHFTAAAVVLRDTLYLYGARKLGGIRPEIVLGRAPLARALDREAWRFHAGHGRWSSEAREAAVVMNAGVQFSVHWNDYLRQFVVVNLVGLDERIEMRTADRLEGPWSPGEVIHMALPPAPEAGWICRPAVHPELSRDRGRVLYLTYERPMGFLDAEVRLVEVVLK